MKRKIIPAFSGMNNTTRPDLIDDQILQKALNYEIINPGYLTKRTEPQEYDTELTSQLSSIFDTVINISPPYYPPAKPSDMGDDEDFIILAYGEKSDAYKMYALYCQGKDSGYAWTSTQLTFSSKISYTSDSNPRFHVSQDRILITDWEGSNIAHYAAVDQDGNIISGIMGISAPLNKPGVTQLSELEEEYFEENQNNSYISKPGLIQACYTVITEEGHESNPSPLSDTLDLQFFKYDDNGDEDRWISKFNLQNLSIPPNLSQDTKDKLTHFKIYVRIVQYSAGYSAQNLEFAQQFQIKDKTNTATTTTNNNYTITVAPTPASIASYENDVAPIAKYATSLAGVSMLAHIKTKTTFPWDFDYYKKITVTNRDNKTYTDAIVRLRLYDSGSGDSDAITNLSWSDYDTNNDDTIDTGLNKLRIYDTDLTTPLSVVYSLDTDNFYCDIYIKIPHLAAGEAHTIYFCFDGDGVTDSDYQTASYGKWIQASSWTGQNVFSGEKVVNSGSILTVPLNNFTQNKANTNNEVTNEGTWNGASITKIPLLGKLYGDNAVKLDAKTENISYVNYDLSLSDDMKFTVWGRIKYNGDDLDTGDSAYRIIGLTEDGTTDFAELRLVWSSTESEWVLTSAIGQTSGEDSPNEYIILGSGSQDYEYFIVFCQDGTTSNILVVNMTSGAISTCSGSTSHTDLSGTLTSLSIGEWNNTYDAILNSIYSQWNLVWGESMFDASNTDDKDTVRNLANLMPPYDTIIGYKYSDTSHNNNIDFDDDTETIEYKTRKNMIKWTDVNGIAFPDLYYKRFSEPINGLLPAPSFLKYQYQNTVLVYTRNTINRFVFQGTPDTWHGSSENIIQEKTEYGLLAPRTLVKVGNNIFWLSEVGVIKWSPQGIQLISKNRLDLDISDGDHYIAFYCPLRNQYLLHSQRTIAIEQPFITSGSEEK